MRKSIIWWATSSVPWPLEFSLLRQRGVAWMLSLSHGLAAWAIIDAGLSLWIKMVLLALVCGLLFYHWRCWFVGVENSVAKLTYTSAQSWSVTLLNGEKIPVVFTSPFWLTPWVSLLRVVQLDEAHKKSIRKFYLIIFPGSAYTDDYRRLLMLLNFPREQ